MSCRESAGCIVLVLLVGCRDGSGPVTPVLETGVVGVDSTSARALNERLLARDPGAIRFAPPPGAEAGRASPRQYIVGFRGSGSDARGEDRATLRAAGATERYYFYGFRATAAYLDSSAISRLRASPAVAWIDSSEGRIGAAAEVTSWNFTKHRFNSAQSAGYFGHGGVRVAVIGDGIQCSLSELSCGTGVNITGNPNVDAGSSHETGVASIIAAGVNNGIGIKGGAPSVFLHSVRAAITGNPPTISCANLAEAIDIAAAPYGLDADIINLSYSENNFTCGGLVDSALKGAVWGNSAIVVVSAGNNGVAQVAYPANHPLTIAVSSMTQSPFKLAPSSNYGPEIDIAVGGQNVKLLDRTGAVVTNSGTSFAAPQVVAALALLYGQKLSEYGCKPDVDEAKSALYNTTQAPDLPIIENWYGAGALDVYAALTSNWVQSACLEW